MSQGANPLRDVGCLEALRLCGHYLLRAVRDAGDREVREQMMYAATLAGIAFGNAGVHLPHGMGYAVASVLGAPGLPGYPANHPLVPHGVSVMLAAPAAFRFTAPACPERHLRAAAALGEDLRGAGPDDAGEVLGAALGRLLRQAGLPGGLAIAAGPVIGLAVETRCQFRRPLAFPVVVDAGLRVGHLGRSSVRYEIGLFAAGDERPAAQGHFVHVFVEQAGRRPVPIPDPLRAALARLRPEG